MDKEGYKYLYGPVPSRRLGLSLGVDIIPSKYCTYSCIYCQLKRTDHLTVERRSFYPVDDILSEIRRRITETDVRPDRITFSGSGEPTLNSDIGRIITEIKSLTDIPVVVITNGSLLWMPDVRNDLLNADFVVPSLDCARPESFRKVNRPHRSLDIERIKQGIIEFRKAFKGQIWLEVLLVHGINDSKDDISSLIDFTGGLKPDRVQLNTVIRPPAEDYAQALTREELERIALLFNPKAEVIAEFEAKTKHIAGEHLEKNLIADMLNRRPCTLKDIAASLAYDEKEIEAAVAGMVKTGEVEARDESSGRYYYLKR
jgi:wyosine [tRNA(Phe)-imidazoG37] synthetase (radical SAM superfamily)